MSRARSVLIGLIFVLGSPSALLHAQKGDPTSQAALADIATCKNSRKNEEGIAACTRAIKSDLLSGRILATIYFFRSMRWMLEKDTNHSSADQFKAMELDPTLFERLNKRDPAIFGGFIQPEGETGWRMDVDRLPVSPKR